MRGWSAVRLDGARLLRRIDELARLGALEGGGCYRPLYSVAWKDALGELAY